MMKKFRITKEKDKKWKDLMLHIREFRVQIYADKGEFPLLFKFYIVYALVFEWVYVCK